MNSFVVKWRVYYADGSTFDSLLGGPELAPCTGVLHIVGKERKPGEGPYIVSGKDYYWHDSNEWWGGDLFGLYDYLARPGLKVAKFGRTVANQEWLDAYHRAHSDPDFFPPKGSYSTYPDREYHPSRSAKQDEAAV